MKKEITVIERYERGGLTAYSVDEGKTFHPTVRQAFEHRDEYWSKKAKLPHFKNSDFEIPSTKPTNKQIVGD